MRSRLPAAMLSGAAALITAMAACALFAAHPCRGEVDEAQDPPFAAVDTPRLLQAAIRAGVRHVVLTGHMDMTSLPTEAGMDPEVQALNTAFGRVSNTGRGQLWYACSSHVLRRLRVLV